MKRALLFMLLTGCASTWPKPRSSTEWNAVLRACRDGDQAACFWRAFDEAPAARQAAFLQQCEANVGPACNELGFLVERTGGGQRAIELWKKACDLGSANGCDSLGTGLRDGVGGTVDEPGAVAAYELACKQRHPAGCTNLGSQLLNGRGVARDAARAELLWRTTCESEEIYESCQRLGLALVRGDGLPIDVDGGVALLKRACRLGDADDCLAASQVFTELKRPDEALRYLRTSCAWKSAQGCLALAKTLRAGSPHPDGLQEANDAERYACSHGGCESDHAPHAE